MKISKRTVMIASAGLGILLAAGFISWWLLTENNSKQQQVTSFAECVAGGNPLQESYPEVCQTPDGQRFSNPLQQADDQKPTTDTTLKHEQLSLTYNSDWQVAYQDSGSSPICGKYDQLVLAHEQFELGFSYGLCGDDGGKCFVDDTTNCNRESEALTSVDLTDERTAYILASRYTTNGGETYSYELHVSDREVCVADSCPISARNVSHKTGTITGRYRDKADKTFTSLDEFTDQPEVKRAVRVLKSVVYN